MMTALLILVAVLVVVGVCCLVNAALNGCPFGWLWVFGGGLGYAVEGLGRILAAIVEGLTSG